MENNIDKYEKLEFSIRMLFLHNYISDTLFERLLIKLEKEKSNE